MDSEKTRAKWNRIYNSAVGQPEPALVVTEYLDLMPGRGRALDIGCGRGSNALLLASHGLTVDAWDISDVAIKAVKAEATKQKLPVHAKVREVNEISLSRGQWDVIVNCHYLDRSLTPGIRSALSPGGFVMFQTFTAEKKTSIGPSNPDFLLAQDELLTMFGGFNVLAYRDETESTDLENPLAGRALIVAQKPA